MKTICTSFVLLFCLSSAADNCLFYRNVSFDLKQLDSASFTQAFNAISRAPGLQQARLNRDVSDLGQGNLEFYLVFNRPSSGDPCPVVQDATLRQLRTDLSAFPAVAVTDSVAPSMIWIPAKHKSAVLSVEIAEHNYWKNVVQLFDHIFKDGTPVLGELILDSASDDKATFDLYCFYDGSKTGESGCEEWLSNIAP